DGDRRHQSVLAVEGVAVPSEEAAEPISQAGDVLPTASCRAEVDEAPEPRLAGETHVASLVPGQRHLHLPRSQALARRVEGPPQVSDAAERARRREGDDASQPAGGD